MHATPPNPARRRLKLALLSLAALVALLILGATVAVHLARGAILAKAEGVAAGFGLSLLIGDVDVPLAGGIGLRDVQVRRADGVVIAHIERIETDVSLIGAALGKRRPGAVELVGGSALVRWRDGPIDLARPAAASNEPDGAPSEPLSVTLRGLALSLEVQQTTPLGSFACEPMHLSEVEASISRDAERRLSGKASAIFATGSHRTAIRVAIDLAAKSLSFEADEGIEVGLQTPFGPTWVALNGARRSPGQPFEASGIGVRRGDQLVQLRRVRLRGGGDELVPRVDLVEGIDVVGISVERGGDRASIGTAALTLAAPVAGGELVAIAGLVPDDVALTEIEGVIRSGGRELSGRVGALDVSFHDLLGQLARGTPLDSVTALRIARPAATLVMPGALEVVQDPAETATGETRPTGADDVPPPFLGNDDDLPPAAVVVPALGVGRDWLAALLGSDIGADDAGAGSLIPAELRTQLPAILARVGALAPEVSDGSLAVVDASGRSLLSLQDAGFSAAKVDAGVELKLRAAVLRDGKEAGRADLRLVLGEQLELDALEGTLSGRSLAHQVARFVSGLSVQEDAEVDVTLQYERPKSENAPHHVRGTLRLASFSFEYWRIADREIRDLEVAVTFDASIDRLAHRLLLSLPDIRVGKATMSASLDLKRRKRHLPSFVARLEMRRQDCGAVAASIPKGLIPNLPTLALKGTMSFEASLTLDLENPRALDLEVVGDGEDCQILSLGPGIDIAALRGPFVHHPREPKRGVLEHIAVGRGTPEWVPSERIPDIVKAAAWVTEDRRWLEHAGVRWDLVERALKIDLEHGRFIYGGSTITQQLVKNLYLTRDKNLARKLEEAIIAWQMERVLSKDEILTTYINCIEYGPDIYGIKQAARIYFAKKPHELDALESAFIMGLKPYPKAGYNQFLKQTLDVWWVRRVSHVLRYMAKFAPDQITLEEAEAFAPFQPAFRNP